MIVIKRDGKKVDFDVYKIKQALIGANSRSQEMSDSDIDRITEIILNKCNKVSGDLKVEDIQDIVEDTLLESEFTRTAKTYILYRDKRTRIRQGKSKLLKEVGNKLMGVHIVNQNANVDERSFGGRKGEADSVLTKQYALDYCMSEKSRNNHLNNEIYIHDLDSYAVGMHNCLSIPFDKLLAEGFNTRQTDVRPAASINTAFQLVAVIFQLQSLQQFGGVSATHLDWTMVPYVRKSFLKHYNELTEFIPFCKNKKLSFEKPEEISIEDHRYFKGIRRKYIAKRALQLTSKELYQAVEGMYHNLNTLQSRSGNQLPFTSINYGTCTLPEGRMVIKALLEGSLKGVGKLHRTPIFPCGIFQYMKGVNDKPGTPNYDLYKLALKSTAKRLYPNYANCNWSVNTNGDEYDVKVRQEYIDSLSTEDYNKLIIKLQEEPELQTILGIILEEGEK